MMTSAQVVETSVTTTDNSPSQDYTHPDDQTTLLQRYRLNGSLSLLVIIINGVSQMHQWQHMKTHLWKRTNEYSLFGASCLINLSAWRGPKV